MKMLVSLLFGLLFCLSACKEKEVETCCEPAAIMCQLLTHNNNGIITRYHYDGTEVDYAVQGNDSTFFIRENGQLKEAKTGNLRAVFIHTADEVSEIRTYNGITEMDRYALTWAGDLLTEVATIAPGSSIPNQKVNFSYDTEGGILSLEVSVADGNGGYIPLIEGYDAQTDGKINPLHGHVPFIFMNLQNPFAFGRSNVAQAKVVLLGDSSALTSTYEYNEYDYPTSSYLFMTGFDQSNEFTYECQ